MKVLLNEPTGNRPTHPGLCIQTFQSIPQILSGPQVVRPVRHFTRLKTFLVAVLLAGFGPVRLAADVPMLLHYQGTVQMSGTNYHGMGYFKFALVNASGTTTYWSNDDSSSSGSQPGNAVPIPVDNGYYSVLLGNTALSGMTTNVPSGVFRANERVWLRIWFGHNTVDYEHMEPDQRIAAVAYAMVAQTVVPGAITASALADGAVTAEKLAANVITSAVIPDDLELGDSSNRGSLKVWPEPPPGVGSAHEAIRLGGDDGGILTKGDITSLGSFRAVMGGIPFLDLGTTMTFVHMRAEEHGGVVTVTDEEGITAGIFGSQTTAGGRLKLNQNTGQVGAELTGDEGGADGGGQLILYQHSGTLAGVQLDGDAGGANGGGSLALYKAGDMNPTVVLQADSAGDGKITTQVLEITGGADVSEPFTVSGPDAAAPGMIVCIDAEHPGGLRLSTRAYDPAVAGVISGAGGVKPGLLMGQQGTTAHGRHPVALTGRVYCRVDADYGAIHPGDLITTSATPGHGMKVVDRSKAPGAVIGKAMTAVDRGKGLVLLLVSLQ